jgi:hypothetical protein
MKPSKQSKKHGANFFKSFSRFLYSINPNKYRLKKLVLTGRDYRPHYGYLVMKSFEEAERLGLSRFSILEFGCAGGSGLIDLEYHVSRFEKYYNIQADIYGFDAGDGLPPSEDYRDVLYLWQEGDYKMDKFKLLKILRRSEVIIGDINVTLPSFLERENLSPIALVFQDMDYYSSTFNSLIHLKNSREEIVLPRVRMYFDDTLYTGKSIGELLAISDFNVLSENSKIERVELEAEFLSAYWHRWIYLGKKFYFLHFYTHSKYNLNRVHKNLEI